MSFESAGLAAAHGIYESVLSLQGTEKALHGEMVALGTIAQLVKGYDRSQRVGQGQHRMSLPYLHLE